jgi:hypothetical protein
MSRYYPVAVAVVVSCLGTCTGQSLSADCGTHSLARLLEILDVPVYAHVVE